MLFASQLCAFVLRSERLEPEAEGGSLSTQRHKGEDTEGTKNLSWERAPAGKPLFHCSLLIAHCSLEIVN
jgi:hypothetical protein